MKFKSVAIAAITTAIVAVSPAVASAHTLKLLSVSVPGVGGFFGPDGNPVPENQPPLAGSYFAGGDRLFTYRGHFRHRHLVGYDHVVCTIVDPSSSVGRCNANLVVGRSAVFGTNFPLDFEASDQKITVGLVGTGRFRHVRSLRTKDIGQQQNASILIVKY